MRNNDEEKPKGAKAIALKAQKKIFSNAAGGNLIKFVIDDELSMLFDHLVNLNVEYLKLQKVPNFQYLGRKVVKNMIKLGVKIGFMRHHNQLNKMELNALSTFRSKFHSLMKALVSFYEVEFTYNREYLIDAINMCHKNLINAIQRNSTDRSLERLEAVIDFYTNEHFLDTVCGNARPAELLPHIRLIVDEIGLRLERKLL